MFSVFSLSEENCVSYSTLKHIFTLLFIGMVMYRKFSSYRWPSPVTCSGVWTIVQPPA